MLTFSLIQLLMIASYGESRQEYNFQCQKQLIKFCEMNKNWGTEYLYLHESISVCDILSIHHLLDLLFYNFSTMYLVSVHFQMVIHFINSLNKVHFQSISLIRPSLYWSEQNLKVVFHSMSYLLVFFFEQQLAGKFSYKYSGTLYLLLSDPNILFRFF